MTLTPSQPRLGQPGVPNLLPHWTEYPNGCGTGDMCAYSAVLADIPVRLMRGWSDASTLTGALSETPFQITSEQQRMLRVFLSRIAPDAHTP